VKLTRIALAALVTALSLQTITVAGEDWSVSSLWPFGKSTNRQKQSRTKAPPKVRQTSRQSSSLKLPKLPSLPSFSSKKPMSSRYREPQKPSLAKRMGDSTKQLWTKTKMALTPSFASKNKRVATPISSRYDANRRTLDSNKKRKKKSGSILASWLSSMKKPTKKKPSRTTPDVRKQQRVGASGR